MTDEERVSRLLLMPSDWAPQVAEYVSKRERSDWQMATEIGDDPLTRVLVDVQVTVRIQRRNLLTGQWYIE